MLKTIIDAEKNEISNALFKNNSTFWRVTRPYIQTLSFDELQLIKTDLHRP
jgi:hypothetical protein